MYSEMLGDFKKLLKVGVMSSQIEVPEKNTLLRGFQYASPETISYGRFCWNGTCVRIAPSRFSTEISKPEARHA